MASNYSLKYNVDIVMCIDATGSMNGILDTVKSNALNFGAVKIYAQIYLQAPAE